MIDIAAANTCLGRREDLQRVEWDIDISDELRFVYKRKRRKAVEVSLEFGYRG